MPVVEQLDYKQEVKLNPEYRMQKLTAREGAYPSTTPLSITTSGGQEVNWDLPATSVFNPARSVLSYTMKVPAVAGKYTYAPVDCWSAVRQIQLLTRSGTRLCDVDHVANYTKLVWTHETAQKDLLDMENHDGASAAASVLKHGALLQKCNADGRVNASISSAQLIAAGRALAADTVEWDLTGGTVDRELEFKGTFNCLEELEVGDVIMFTAGNLNGYSLTVNNVASNELVSVSGGAAVADIAADTFANKPFIIHKKGEQSGGVYLGSTDARRPDDSALIAGTGTSSIVDVPHLEKKYLSVSGYGADNFIKVKMPLSMIYNSILAVDKSLYFDEVLQLRLVFNPSARVYWSADDPSAPNSTPVAAAATVEIHDPILFLATEQRAEVVQALRQKHMSGGLKYQVPFVHSYKHTFTGGGTNQSSILRLDRGHGKTLKRIYSSWFNPTENSYTVYDSANNLATKKITELYDQTDYKRHSDFNINMANGEDYMLLEPQFKGSCILNSDIYRYNWSWIRNYAGDSPIHAKDPNDQSGLDLSQERRYEIYATTNNAAYHLYQFAVTTKEAIFPKGQGVILQ